MINLKNNIWVKGRYGSLEISRLNIIHSLGGDEILYCGKTSDLPENIAEECVKYGSDQKTYSYLKPFNYQTGFFEMNTAKESFESAITNPDGSICPFCIVIKKLK